MKENMINLNLGTEEEPFLFDKNRLSEDKIWIYIIYANINRLYFFEGQKEDTYVPYDMHPAVIKIGFTKNPEQRIKQIQHQNFCAVYMKHLIECGIKTSGVKKFQQKGWGYLALERQLHLFLSDFQLGSEWFKIPAFKYKRILNKLKKVKPPTSKRNIPMCDFHSEKQICKWVTESYIEKTRERRLPRNPYRFRRFNRRYDDGAWGLTPEGVKVYK